MRRPANGALVAALVLSACAGESPGPAATETPSASGTSSPTPANALPDLAPFFAKARAVDTRLRTAALRINAGVGATRITFDASTVAAVRAADPVAVLDAIPAGIERPLLRAVLTVYSDLVSRHRAMAYVRVGTFDLAGTDGAEILRCLRNGHAAAVRFLDDLREAERLAGASDPAGRVSPTSRVAAELAVRAADIRLRNSGCGECGGYVATSWPAVRWDDAASGTRYTGTVAAVAFVATYDRDRRWTVRLNAC